MLSGEVRACEGGECGQLRHQLRRCFLPLSILNLRNWLGFWLLRWAGIVAVLLFSYWLLSLGLLGFWRLLFCLHCLLRFDNSFVLQHILLPLGILLLLSFFGKELLFLLRDLMGLAFSFSILALLLSAQDLIGLSLMLLQPVLFLFKARSHRTPFDQSNGSIWQSPWISSGHQDLWSLVFFFFFFFIFSDLFLGLLVNHCTFTEANPKGDERTIP